MDLSKFDWAFGDLLTWVSAGNTGEMLIMFVAWNNDQDSVTFSSINLYRGGNASLGVLIPYRDPGNWKLFRRHDT